MPPLEYKLPEGRDIILFSSVFWMPNKVPGT